MHKNDKYIKKQYILSYLHLYLAYYFTPVASE